MAMGKVTNKAASYRHTLSSSGITASVSWLLCDGCDGDTPAVFEQTLRFCEDARLEAAIFPILTPYHGTKCGRDLSLKGGLSATTGRITTWNMSPSSPEG